MPDQENQNEQTGARRNFSEWQDWLDEETRRLKEKKGRILDPAAPPAQPHMESDQTLPGQPVKQADHYARVISSAFPEQPPETPQEVSEKVPSDAALNSVEAQTVETEIEPGDSVPAENLNSSKFDKHLDELFSEDRRIDIPGKRAYRHNTDHLEKKKAKPRSPRSRKLNLGIPSIALLSWLTELLIQHQK